jgi:dihydroorotase
MNILIKNGRVIDPSVQLDKVTDVYIQDNKINKIGENLEITADKTIDANGKWVVPGLIDIHVHLREPGFEHKETIKTGSRAAAKGGFTTICCMPNTNPVIDSEIMVEYINLKSSREAVVNVLPIGSITKGQKGEELANIGQMAKVGACAISEDGKTVVNSGLLKKAMKYASMFHIPMMSHCEDISLVGGGSMNAGASAELLGMKGISNDSEEVIVGRDIILARTTGVHLHLCHISTKGSLQLLKEAKARGEKVSAEVTPHHFTLTDAAVEGYDANTKMNPPLRTDEDVQALRQGLADGTIEVIATDHAPHHSDDKNCEYDKAAFGIVGLETSVALSITSLIETEVLTPLSLIEKMSTNPAKILGIDKGTLQVGKIADITIIDPETSYKVDINEFESKGKNTPFDGYQVKGKPIYTIVAGQIVMDHGHIMEVK